MIFRTGQPGDGVGQCSLNSPSNACRDAAGGGGGVGGGGGGGGQGGG